MTIKEIELTNFRIYKGVNKISLETEEDKNIIVISGKNGFGKTTFLMSLVWCLYGRQMQKVDEPYDKEIRSKGGYSQYISDSLNRLAAAEGECQFSVAVTFQNVKVPTISCNEVKVIRTFDVRTNSPDQVTILIDGQKNELIQELERDNQKGEEIFIREFILPLEIAKFFFFDAEKIVSIAEANSPDQRKQLSHAYSEVLGIHKYEELKQNLETLQDEYRKESAKPEERKEFEQTIADISKYRIEIEEREQRIEEKKEAKITKRYESDEIQRKLISEGNKMTLEELQSLKDREKILDQKMLELQSDLQESIDLVPFAMSGSLLKHTLEQVEDEELLRKNKFQLQDVEDRSYALLNELEESRAKSGIKFESRNHEFYTQEIKRLIKKHFFPDVPESPETTEVFHEFSDTAKNELKSLIGTLVTTFKQRFKALNREFSEAKNELLDVRKKIFSAEKQQESDYIAGLRRDKEVLENQITILEEEIIELVREIEHLKVALKSSEKRRTELGEKITISQKNKKKDEKTRQLIKELNDFVLKFKEEKKKSLEAGILSGLESLLHKKDFVKRVVVDISIGDDVDINLQDKRGKKINKESLSMGEKQMYASALLKALVEESEIEFPVFIDSPMQKFDEEHAQNIIRGFYPKISEQVILFPLINKEMTEKEFALLKRKIAKAYIIENSVDQSRFLGVEPDKLIDQYNNLYNAN
jgi:DNA sulfur modification protein DndD